MKKYIKIVLFILFFIILVIMFGFLETKRFKIKEYNIIDKSLPSSFNGIKIVHFGDILYGTSINKNMLKKIINEINTLKPDIVIFTGDLYPEGIKLTKDNEKDIKNILGKIDASLYKYAIKGDNDTDNYNHIMSEAGFILLDNTKEKLYYKGNTPIIISNTTCEEDLFSIRLIHKPDDVDNLDFTNINLIIAGHSLNGQIRIPFYGGAIKKEGSKKYLDEKYMVNNIPFYITNGLGTNSFKFRLFNTPSFNLYRLTNY
ncbi:MAG: metallophosphoesterase [Bacilli bacterium]|nr:metallophosphoesterase [Bacilli bacterium]